MASNGVKTGSSVSLFLFFFLMYLHLFLIPFDDAACDENCCDFPILEMIVWNICLEHYGLCLEHGIIEITSPIFPIEINSLKMRVWNRNIERSDGLATLHCVWNMGNWNMFQLLFLRRKMELVHEILWYKKLIFLCFFSPKNDGLATWHWVWNTGNCNIFQLVCFFLRRKMEIWI